MMLTADEVDEEFVKKAKIFHFGTLSMTHDGVREATKKALKIAKDNGLVITFDPNLRPPLWSSLELAKEQMEYGFAYCDVLKISDNEIQFISGKEDYDEGIRYLQEKYQIPLILLTPDSGKTKTPCPHPEMYAQMPMWCSPLDPYIKRRCRFQHHPV